MRKPPAQDLAWERGGHAGGLPLSKSHKRAGALAVLGLPPPNGARAGARNITGGPRRRRDAQRRAPPGCLGGGYAPVVYERCLVLKRRNFPQRSEAILRLGAHTRGPMHRGCPGDRRGTHAPEPPEAARVVGDCFPDDNGSDRRQWPASNEDQAGPIARRSSSLVT
jgi:hypothetical protein